MSPETETGRPRGRLALLLACAALVALSACGNRAERPATPAVAARAEAPNQRARATAPHDAQSTSEAPEIVRLEVGGMTCQGCVARIQASLAAVPGVHRVDVSLDEQRAVVLADRAVRDTALTGAVRRAGPEFLGIVLR